MYIGILKDNKWGVIDRNGNLILEPYYDKEDVDRFGTAYHGNGVFFIGKWVLCHSKYAYLSLGVSTNEELKTMKVPEL